MFGKPTTSLFGAPGNTSFGSNTFGTPNNATFGGGATFGSSPFGSSNQPTSTGLFGSTNPAATSLFGGANTSAFGTSTGNNAFNFAGGTGLQTSQQSANLFGSSASSGYASGTASLFGQGAQQTTGFGQPAGGGMNLFGGATASNAPSFLGGLGSQQSGTTIKFVPVSGSDAMMKAGTSINISTKMFCITGMKEYENKSFEELRFEDYQANRKSGPTLGGGFLSTSQQQSQPSGFGMFGNQNKSAFSGFTTSTAASTSLFGSNLSQAKPMFGGATTTTTASSGFGGLSSGSPFGGNKPGGLFGTTATTTQSSFGIFGTQPQASTAFGLGSQSTNAGGIFGAKPLSFGQTGTSSTFTFGTAQTAQSGLGGAFGAGTFNKTAASGATGFGLGTQNTSLGFGGFGSTPLGSTPGFGAIGSSNTTGSLFSNQQKPAGSIFGNTATSGFGLGGGLGNTTLTTGGLGAANTGTLGTGMFGAGTCFGGQTRQVQQQQQNTELLMLLEQQKQIQHHIAALNASPYGDNPLFKNLLADPSRQNELLKPTNPMAQQTLLSTQLRYKHSQDRPAIKTVPLTDRTEKSLLFDCLDDDAPGSANQNQNLEETFVPRKNYKYLDVKSILQQQQTYNNMKEALDQSRTGSPQPSANVLDGNRRSPIVIGPSNGDFGQLGRSSVRTKSRHDLEDSRYDGNPLNNTMDELIPKNVRPLNLAEHDDHHNSVPTNGMMAVHVSPKTSHLAGVVLTRPDYFTLPSLEEMEGLMNEDGKCIVRDLVIGREGYGNVLFPGETDVTNLNLDELVHFRRKEIEIYPDTTKKHPRGEGLNKKAQVTLDMVYPIDKTTKQPITDYNRLMSMGFVEKLERKCISMQAKFVEYRPETGSYVFIVDHFSKYGMLDDSDDDEELVEGAKKTGVDQLGKKPLQQQAQPVGTPKKTAKEQPKQLFATPIQPVRHAHFMKNGDEDDEDMTCDDEDDKFQRLTKRVKVTPYPKMGFTVGDDTVEDDDEIGESKENSFFSSGKGVAYDEDDRAGSDDENDAMCFGSQLKSPTYETLGQVSAHQVQLQKASFFGGLIDDDEEEEDDEAIKRKARVVRESMFKDLSFSSNKQSVISSPFANNASMMIQTDIISRQSPSLPPHSFSVRVGLKSQNLPPASTTTISVLPKVAVAFKSSHPIIPSRMTEEDLKALDRRLSTVVMARKQVCIPLEKSLMFRKQNLTHDLGLFQGASTRTGWGSYMGEDCPGWPLVHVGPAICGLSEAEGKTNNFGLMARQNAMKLLDTGDSSFVAKVERILPPASFGDGNGMRDVLEVCLQAELDHCQVECSLMEVGGEENAPLEPSSACPFISYSTEPQSLLREVTNELLKLSDQSDWGMNMSSVWKLCLSLWGDLGAVDGSNLDDYYVQSLRKEAVTGWLVEDAAKRIAEEIKLLGGDNSDGSVTFSHLTGFQVKHAVEAAMKVKDFHMSLILSQASCPDDVRLMLRKQLELWSDSKSDQFMSESRLAIFALLGGVLMLRTSKGQINCCKSLDWKRCFGLHLWYACPSTCTVSEALREYEHGYQGSTPHGRYCAAPNPPYMERWGLDEEAGVVDVTFHLLKLFCNKSYPLHKILNPASFSENDLDYSCSWHLLKLLGSLGYQHISDFHLASVCHNYASQLEAIGQWHWAAFVLMHIKHPISRSDAVKKLVTRNVELLQQDEDVDENKVNNDDEDMSLLNDKEKFLVEKLRIPVEWIHEAKAVKANSEGQEKLRSFHLFKAQQFILYHDLVVNKLAPQAVVDGDHKSLRKWFISLDEGTGWTAPGGRFEQGGAVYLRYLRLLEIVGSLEGDDHQDQEEISHLLDELELLVHTLTTGIKYLPSSTPIDRYAQHLMSQSLLKASLKLVSSDRGTYEANEDYVVQLRDVLLKLPMSEELVEETQSRLGHEHLKNTIMRNIEVLC